MSLEPIDPETAYELYLADREHELSEASLKGHRYRLKHFVRWLESIDAVEQNLSEKVLSPNVTPDENSRDVMLEADRADTVLAYLAKYKYASVQHVAIALMWHSMMRVGGVHALDVGDYHPEKQYLEVRHRPDTGTPIKNKGDGERLIAISDRISDLLDDAIDHKLTDVTDDHGREPLLSSAQGRTQTSTLRAYVYRWTRPCMYGQDCPHDRDPNSCEATQHDAASKCPSSVSPHAIRRGSITDRLNNEMPEKVVSDRANVSPAVIEQHYDRRTEREKMEQRRDYLDDQ